MSASPEERARLFVALELPASARDILARWRGTAVREIGALRPVPVEYLHATLCFLGSRPVRELDEIAAACRVVAGEPGVDAQLGEPLWLPRRRPGVLAVGLENEGGALARIQTTLSSALAAGGWYVPESRPFLAHVTVARVAKNARIRPPALDPPPAVSAHCSRVTLYRSRLGSGGARYEPLSFVELGSSPVAMDPVPVDGDPTSSAESPGTPSAESRGTPSAESPGTPSAESPGTPSAEPPA